jgi:transposase
LLAVVNRQIEELATAIAALIDADPLWCELNCAFRTIKGVADRTVARLMAEMPEIGVLSQQDHLQARRSGPASLRLGQVPGQAHGPRRPRRGA